MSEGPSDLFPATGATPPQPDQASDPSTRARSLEGANMQMTPSTSATGSASVSAGVNPRRGSVALVGGAVGFALGLLVGWSLGSSSKAPNAAAIPSAAVPTPLVTGGPAEVAIDFGNDDADRALRGPWTKAQLGQHSVSETPGPLSSIEIPLSPAAAKGYSLGVLAQAIGIAPDEALEVGVRLNKHQVGRWKIGPEWDMQAIVLPPGSLAAGLNVVEFAMPASAGARRPMLAIDTLHLGVLLPHAEAGLAAVGVRGGLIRGFYGKEGEGADAVTWSAGLRTRVGLLVAPSTSDYELELRGYAFGPLQPLDVQAFVNSKSVGTARVDTGPRNVFRVPAGTLTPGLNIVEFVYPKAVKPADAVKGSEDQRELAIRISQVSVAPATGPKQ